MPLYQNADHELRSPGQRDGRGLPGGRGDHDGGRGSESWRGPGGLLGRGSGTDDATRGGWRGRGGSGEWRGRGGLVDRGLRADRGARGAQSWRGRGGFGVWAPQGSGQQAKLVSASPPPPLGDLIETISREDIEEPADADGHCEITSTRLVASYNWMNSTAGPKIMIPGSPPLWTPRKGPYQLRPDNGIYYRDPNAAAYGDHPMEAAIISVMKMNPPSSNSHPDLFACGSTLGNLLRFVRGLDCPFRMLVEVVGNTVHLIRRENSPKEQIIGIKGFGHAFPEENTTWEPDVMGSNSHQRILRYQFNGLDMMVRFEGDGYTKLIDKEERRDSPAAASVSAQPDSLLSDGLQALEFQTKAGTPFPKALQTVTGGRMIPQEAMFDIKTRSVNVMYRDTLGEELPRLWLAQVKRFILAYHTRGEFEDVEIQDVSKNVQAWEADNQTNLQRFARLLRLIIQSRLKEGPDVKVEILRREGSDCLEILKRLPDAGTPFSDKTRRKWSDWLSGFSDGSVVSDEGSLGQEGEEPGNCSGDDSEDFTACDEDCGYCGRCATSLI